MRALVVYESMYGNTHIVADEIATGLLTAFEVTIVPVDDATPSVVAEADLLVVGGPTHVHGLSSARSRQAAVEATAKDADLQLDAHAKGAGLREWLDALEVSDTKLAAAFDTRLRAVALLTGRASRGIERRLRRRGCRLVAPGESFLVDKHNRLLPGEADRARRWGERIAQTASTAAA
ncbi:MAG TPA: flavodoxin domain-containing protein [Acidimicrobiales bacterium]